MNQVNNEFFPMQVVCAYCGIHLYWAYCRRPDKISDGICDGCAEKVRASWGTEKLPRRGDNLNEMQNL